MRYLCVFGYGFYGIWLTNNRGLFDVVILCTICTIDFVLLFLLLPWVRNAGIHTLNRLKRNKNRWIIKLQSTLVRGEKTKQ